MSKGQRIRESRSAEDREELERQRRERKTRWRDRKETKPGSDVGQRIEK